jgi:hypothetical protein
MYAHCLLCKQQVAHIAKKKGAGSTWFLREWNRWDLLFRLSNCKRVLVLSLPYFFSLGEGVGLDIYFHDKLLTLERLLLEFWSL